VQVGDSVNSDVVDLFCDQAFAGATSYDGDFMSFLNELA
jgi:hypothetical protein